MKRWGRPMFLAGLGLAACAPPREQPRQVPIAGAQHMTRLEGQALQRLVRDSVQTRTGGGTTMVETFSAGDAYTLAYDRPDSSGHYVIGDDRVCLRFARDRSRFCRFYLRDAHGRTWLAEDDRDYPLHPVAVTIRHPG